LRRAAAFAVACLTLNGVAACGDDSATGPLRERARELAAVAAPAGWGPLDALRLELTEDQRFDEVDGVRMLFSGDFSSGGIGQATSVGVAWQSPVIDDATDVGVLCAQVADYAARAGVRDVMGADETAGCLAAPTDPGLQPGFVVPYSASVVHAGGGSDSFSGGVLLADDGTVRLVVSLSYVIDP
jgi:hypothetical protein